MTQKTLNICILAVEPSGDVLGAHVMKALKETSERPINFTGLGGAQMEKEGLSSLFDISDLAVMGLAEVLPKIKFLLKKIRQVTDFIVKTKPDIVLTIDGPDFTFRVQKKVHKRFKDAQRPRQIHMVAPTVWAWRAGRARKIARFLDGLICLFDFEPPYFEKEGLKSCAAGHPVIESGALEAEGQTFRQRHGIEGQALGLLFGSRSGEIERHGHIILETAKAFPHVSLIVPTLPRHAERIKNILAGLPNKVVITTDPDEKWSAFKACDAALAVSGTVGLELAVCKVPHVICYKMNPLSWMIAKRVLKTDYAHLANIMMKREIVPEFIQERCRAPALIPSVKALLTYGLERENQLSGLQDIGSRIGANDPQTPSEKSAAFILSFVKS